MRDEKRCRGEDKRGNMYSVLYSIPRKRDRNRRKKKTQDEETGGRKQQKGEEADTGGGSRNRKGNIERQQK